MAKNSMSISNFLKLAKMLPNNVSLLMRADHGVGKSQVIAQLADWIRQTKYEGDATKFPLIDRRLGQITEGDILGLPSTDGNVTRFNPPDWVKKACTEPCMLFLDEINRATTEVMQASFQLVLDRELCGWKLHPDTYVAAAVNTGASYTVNEMDPALLDRFWTIDLVPTAAEWIAWAKTCPDMADVAIDFIRSNEKWLDPPDECEPGSVQTSRRSWQRLCAALKHAGLVDDPNIPEFYTMCLGFIGVEATIAFCDFAKNYDVQVSAADVMNKLVKKVVTEKTLESVQLIGTPEDKNVYNERLLERLQGFTQEKLLGMIEKVGTYVKKEYKGKGLNPKQGVAIARFTTILPAELRIKFWTELISEGIDDMQLSRDVHLYAAPGLMKPFGVPMGKAGVGVVPNIPEIFNKK